MRRHGTIGAAAFAVIIALPSCAPGPALDEEPEAVAAPPEQRLEALPEEELEAWTLMVDGQPVDELLRDRERADAILQRLLGAPLERTTLERLVADIKEGRTSVDLPGDLSGIGLFTTVQFFDAYLAALDDAEATQTLSGKIQDYIFDDAQKAGHLAVDTRLEFFDTAASAAAMTPDRVERYHWDIEVLDGTYEVVPRSTIPTDPFPGTLQFSPEMIAKLTARGLDHKLWAIHDASSNKIISVRNVYQLFDDGSITRLPNGHRYYQTSDESCIDMMFAGYPAAHTLPAQPAYCLGRCAEPQIINTH